MVSGFVRIQDSSENGRYWVGFKAPEDITQTIVWTLPITDGTSGQALVTNGSGVLTWVSGGGGVSAPEFYEFTQSANLSIWAITHNLNKKPSVTVQNSTGDTLLGEIQYIDNSSLLFKLNLPSTGKAYLN